MCTTVPAAKSSAPSVRRNPPSPTPNARAVIDERRPRERGTAGTPGSASARRQRPRLSDTVITANIAWNIADARCGIRCRVCRIRGAADTANPAQDTPPSWRRRREGERVSDHDPLHGHDASARATSSCCSACSPANEPSIEERKTGHHQHHQRGGHDTHAVSPAEIVVGFIALFPLLRRGGPVSRRR